MSASELDAIAPARLDPAASVFDAAFYSRQTGRFFDLYRGLADYRSRGEAEGFCPHPLFQPSHVAGQLPAEMSATKACVFNLYFELAADDTNLDPHPLFDAAHYTSLAGPFGAGQTPLEHYVATLAAGCVPPSPSILFDRAHYGVVQNQPCNLLHYVTHGARERRSPHPLFLTPSFLSGCAKAGIPVSKDADPLQVYLTNRRTWDVPTHVLFDPLDYAKALERLGLPLWQDVPPLVHFLRQPVDVSTHFVFDPVFYRRHAAALGIALAEPPILHHVRTGGRSGVMPHPLFSPAYYLANNADVNGTRLDPLLHFLRHGRNELRAPHPLLALRSSTLALPPADEHKTDRFSHYVRTGGQTLADPHPLFDAALYAAAQPDCLAPGSTPLGHFAHRWSQAGVFCPPWGTALFERRPAFGPPGRVDLIVVSHELTRTGAPLILLALVKEFVSRLGLECLVITVAGGVLLEAFREWAPVIDLSLVHEAGLKRDQFLQNCLAAFEGATRPRAALVNTACVDMIGRLLAASGLPVITLVHELAAAFDRRVFDSIYEASSCVIYPAAYVQREAHTTYTLPIEKTAVLPQGLLDPAYGTGDRGAARREVLDELDAPDTAFIVLGCGTLDLRKGLDLFANVATAAIAAQEADSASPPARPLYFVWVGGGPTHRHSLVWYIQEDVGRAGLSGRLQFLGPRAGTESFFLASDAFLLTSRLDPFPCVVHEAMACALPVIAFENAGGAPEALLPDAGIVVPYGDTGAMAASLVRLASAPAEAAAIGERARTRVRQTYDFAAYADAVIDAFATRAGLSLLAPDDPQPRRPWPRQNRVVFTLPEASANAQGRSVAALIAGLSARGFDAELILTAPRAYPAAIGGLGGVPRRVLGTSLSRPLAAGAVAEALATALPKAAPAIVVPGTADLATALAAQRPARLGLLGLLTHETTQALESAARFGANWQRCVVTSEAARARLLDLAPALSARCEVIPPGFKLTPVPQLTASSQPIRLLCLLPLIAAEGAGRPAAALIDAVSGINCTLTLIGNGTDMAAFATLFAAQVSAGRLVLLGAPDDGVLMPALHAAEVLITFDDLAFAAVGIGDALSAGLAVIDAAGRPAVHALNRSAETGCVVPQGNIRAIARVVGELAADRERLLACRLRAQELARARFIGIEENLDRTAALLERMLEEIRQGVWPGAPQPLRP